MQRARDEVSETIHRFRGQTTTTDNGAIIQIWSGMVGGKFEGSIKTAIAVSRVNPTRSTYQRDLLLSAGRAEGSEGKFIEATAASASLHLGR